MKHLARRLSVFAFVLSVVSAPSLGVADVVEVPSESQARSQFQWTFGLMLGAVTIGGIYGLSTMDGGNNYIGALYLFPALHGPLSTNEKGSQTPGLLMWGGFAAISALNFFAWKNENVSRQQLFTNNMIGLAASIAVPLLVWKIGEKSDETSVFLIPSAVGSQLAVHSSF